MKITSQMIEAFSEVALKRGLTRGHFRSAVAAGLEAALTEAFAPVRYASETNMTIFGRTIYVAKDEEFVPEESQALVDLFTPLAQGVILPLRVGEWYAYIHAPCRCIELWNEAKQGPINDQGCDACDSAPDGEWCLVYVRRPAHSLNVSAT